MKTILNQIQEKINSQTNYALEQIQSWKKQNKSIVFSNGCFDILHQGHIVYLAKASEFGNKLIIGLNSDESVRRLKGKNRPINNEQARALLLASLSFVDMVIFFNEDTPYNLIKNITPDVLVKGADYNARDIVGYDIVTSNGGRVETIELEGGFSSTNIIKAIKNNEQ